MLKASDIDDYRRKSFEMFKRAGLVFKPEEEPKIEIADFGLSDFKHTGLGVYVYVNADRYCAKELAMWPGQTCPQHHHPNVKGQLGKQETFRVRWGKMWLYVPGDKSRTVHATAPPSREQTYTVWHEIELNPGDQYTIPPGTVHWFQAGPEGCVVSEFSSRSIDESDVFTDPEIERFTRIAPAY